MEGSFLFFQNKRIDFFLQDDPADLTIQPTVIQPTEPISIQPIPIQPTPIQPTKPAIAAATPTIAPTTPATVAATPATVTPAIVTPTIVTPASVKPAIVAATPAIVAKFEVGAVKLPEDSTVENPKAKELMESNKKSKLESSDSQSHHAKPSAQYAKPSTQRIPQKIAKPDTVKEESKRSRPEKYHPYHTNLHNRDSHSRDSQSRHSQSRDSERRYSHGRDIERRDAQSRDAQSRDTQHRNSRRDSNHQDSYRSQSRDHSKEERPLCFAPRQAPRQEVTAPTHHASQAPHDNVPLLSHYMEKNKLTEKPLRHKSYDHKPYVPQHTSSVQLNTSSVQSNTSSVQSHTSSVIVPPPPPPREPKLAKPIQPKISLIEQRYGTGSTQWNFDTGRNDAHQYQAQCIAYEFLATIDNGTGKIVCNQCKEQMYVYEFATHSLTRSHMEYEFQDQRYYECKICKIKCDSLDHWHMHEKHVDFTYVIQDTDFECESCGFVFPKHESSAHYDFEYRKNSYLFHPRDFANLNTWLHISKSQEFIPPKEDLVKIRNGKFKIQRLSKDRVYMMEQSTSLNTKALANMIGLMTNQQPMNVFQKCCKCNENIDEWFLDAGNYEETVYVDVKETASGLAHLFCCTGGPNKASSGSESGSSFDANGNIAVDS